MTKPGSDIRLPEEGPVDRWTAARKEEVVRRILTGEMSAGAALRKWKMTVEELDSWLQRFRAAGRRGLKASNQGRLF